jgi:hypothetical protein
MTRRLSPIERGGFSARIGVLLSGTWIVCMFVFHPWEPIESADANRTVRSRTPGEIEQLTRFFWKIGAQTEESATNLFWRPPAIPILSVSDQSEMSIWIYGNSYRFNGDGELLDYLASAHSKAPNSLPQNTKDKWAQYAEPATQSAPSIQEVELSAARNNGYRDWEILEILRYGRHPWVLEDLEARRRQAFNPFRGLIASSVAMVTLFCLPLVLGWVFRPLAAKRPE